MISSSTPPSDRIRGALLGLAWGDVLGCPVEGWDARHIRAVYGTYDDLPSAYPARFLREGGQRWLSRLRPLRLHSDDTQQALALLNVCLSPGGWSAAKWAACLAQGMAARAWRGYGQNFNGAVVHLARGVPPQRARQPHRRHRRGDTCTATRCVAVQQVCGAGRSARSTGPIPPRWQPRSWNPA